MPDETRKSASDDPVVGAAAEVVDDRGVTAAGAIAVQGDHAVIVAQFADDEAARAVYDQLRGREAVGGYHIDGVLVAKADSSGKVKIQKMTDHTSRNGFLWGAVAGVVVGVIFPPSIIGSAAVLGATGLAMGKAGNVLKKSSVADALTDVITPGTSGIVALVDLTDVPAVEREMPEARVVKSVPVDTETAEAIKAASKAAGTQPTAS